MKKFIRTLFILVGIVAIMLPVVGVLADGDETLGTPSISIAEGTGVIVAGLDLRTASQEP